MAFVNQLGTIYIQIFGLYLIFGTGASMKIQLKAALYFKLIWKRGQTKMTLKEKFFSGSFPPPQ